MNDIGKYGITYFGEFIDKTLEDEFFAYDMKRYTRLIGAVVLVFGIVFFLFLIFDYNAIENIYSFSIILVIMAILWVTV